MVFNQPGRPTTESRFKPSQAGSNGFNRFPRRMGRISKESTHRPLTHSEGSVKFEASEAACNHFKFTNDVTFPKMRHIRKIHILESTRQS